MQHCSRALRPDSICLIITSFLINLDATDATDATRMLAQPYYSNIWLIFVMIDDRLAVHNSASPSGDRHESS